MPSPSQLLLCVMASLSSWLEESCNYVDDTPESTIPVRQHNVVIVQRPSLAKAQHVHWKWAQSTGGMNS